MRVASLTQSIKTNKLQAKQERSQITLLNKVSKLDSVSFSGKEKLTEEVFKAIKSAKKVEIYEKPSYCVAQLVVNVDGIKYALTKRSKKFLGAIFEKYRLEKQIPNKVVKKQKVDSVQFVELVKNIKKAAVPRILQKHGFEQNNVVSLLNDVKVALEKKQAKMHNSSGTSSNHGDIFSEYLALPEDRVIGLHYAPKAKIYELSLGHDRILLTNNKEIEKFKAILGSKGFKIAKNDFSKKSDFGPVYTSVKG